MGFTILIPRTYDGLGVTVNNVYITNKNSWTNRKNTEGKVHITSSYYGYTTSEYANKTPIDYGHVSIVLDENPADFQTTIYTEIKSKMGVAAEDILDDL